MRTKKSFPAELAFVIGLVLIAFSVTLAQRADFGLSMIVAPAYLLHRFLEPYLPFFSFGMAEYCFQGFLILLTALITRRFRVGYVLSFVTAVLYGLTLDGLNLLVAFLPADALWLRLIWFALSIVICAAGVSLMFHSYLPPEAYELIVMEISDRYHLNIVHFKTAYDLISCAVAIAMSFLIFGLWHFEGVSWGTIVIALINGYAIGRFSHLFEKRFEFRDALPWRPFFTGEKPKK